MIWLCADAELFRLTSLTSFFPHQVLTEALKSNSKAGVRAESHLYPNGKEGEQWWDAGTEELKAPREGPGSGLATG